MKQGQQEEQEQNAPEDNNLAEENEDINFDEDDDFEEKVDVADELLEERLNNQEPEEVDDVDPQYEPVDQEIEMTDLSGRGEPSLEGQDVGETAENTTTETTDVAENIGTGVEDAVEGGLEGATTAIEGGVEGALETAAATTSIAGPIGWVISGILGLGGLVTGIVEGVKAHHDKVHEQVQQVTSPYTDASYVMPSTKNLPSLSSYGF